MKTFRSIPLALLFVSSTAWADLPIKIGLGPVFDLQGDSLSPDAIRCSDPIGGDGIDVQGAGTETSWSCGSGFPIGGRLLASARIRLSDRASIRVGPRIEGGTRSGAVQYQCAQFGPAVPNDLGPGSSFYTGENRPCGEEPGSGETIQTGGHFAATVLLGLSVGPEFAVPVGSNSVYFGAELSAGVAWSFDSLGPSDADGVSPTDGVLDDYKDAGCNPCSLETSTFPAFFGAEILAGYRLGGSTPLFFEGGYSTARIGQFNAQPGYDNTNLESLAYTWNPIRLTVGVEVEL